MWGRSENSPYFTIIPSIFNKNGVNLPKHNEFKLESKEVLREKFEKAGFRIEHQWY